MESLFITCSDHLESLLMEELKLLGIDNLKMGFRGVYAPNSVENIYKINYLSRLATRVLLPLAQFACPDKDALYHEARKIPWLDYIDETKTFAIDANVHHPQIRHSLFGAQVVKDALCDVIREKKGERPSVDVKNPQLQFNLFIQKNRATISLDTSGAPLYKRGWKEKIGEATMPETLAAAILIRTGYSARETFCDPFCGSGTFLIEAACIATQTPAGFFRNSWGFFHLPTFNPEEWNAFKAHHDNQRRPLEPRSIIGADQDVAAIAACQDHLVKTGFDDQILLVRSSIDKLTLPRSPTFIVTDPPFGKRMETSTQLYRDFGQFLRARCPATPWAYMLTSSFHFVKATGCSVLSESPLQHGGLKLNLYQLNNS